MKISVSELTELQNVINTSNREAYKEGVRKEKERVLPSNLFNAFLDFAKKSNTLIDYHRSSDKSDGCNWIQVKPTRDGSEGVEFVEISFEENLMEIHHIGTELK